MRIHFTQDDVAHRCGIPFEQISLEEKPDCNGEICGARPELILPEKEYQEHVAAYGETPLRPHSHLIGSRNLLGARRYVYKVF